MNDISRPLTAGDNAVAGALPPLVQDDPATEVKSEICRQLREAMRAQGLSKAELARRLQTSRSQLDRLLSPLHRAVELQTLVRAAQALGGELKVELVPRV